MNSIYKETIFCDNIVNDVAEHGPDMTVLYKHLYVYVLFWCVSGHRILSLNTLQAFKKTSIEDKYGSPVIAILQQTAFTLIYLSFQENVIEMK